MTELEAINTIYERWIEGWAALHPSDDEDPNYVPYALKGETFTKDALGALGAWARVEVRHSTRLQATMGQTSKDSVRGFVFVQLFVDRMVSDGVATLADLADDVRATLAKQNIEGLNLFPGETRDPVGDDDSGWAMGVVVIPFRYQHTS